MVILVGRKMAEHYKGLLIKADKGLHEQIAGVIQRELPLGAEILDLGAGEGALSARLVDLGFIVTAADRDHQSFKCNDVQFHRVDFDSLEDIDKFVLTREDRFDAVIGIEVIEHVQDQWRYARQLLKMVRPGGLVLVTTPNITSWLSRLIFLFTGRFHQFADADLSYGHISPVSPWELGLILRSAGAENVEIRAAGTLPPVYFTGSLKLLVLNALALLLRPFSRGQLDGWCVMATGRKPK